MRSRVEGTHTHKECTFYTHTFALADTSLMHAVHTHTHTKDSLNLYSYARLHSTRASPPCTVSLLCGGCRLAGVKGQDEPLMRDAMRDLEASRLSFK